jgi:hypothetical protein
MTALPIILDAKQYKEYLALRTEPTNQINDAKLIETLKGKRKPVRGATDPCDNHSGYRDPLWGTILAHIPESQRQMDRDEPFPTVSKDARQRGRVD